MGRYKSSELGKWKGWRLVCWEGGKGVSRCGGS